MRQWLYGLILVECNMFVAAILDVLEVIVIANIFINTIFNIIIVIIIIIISL
jgi:hypothetical protein